jgi:hypothetical protein
VNPIAVYQARRPFARIRYELYEDSIRVVGSRNGVDFDTMSPLARLDSRPDSLRVHSFYFYVGTLLVMAAAVSLMAFVTLAEMQDRPVSLARPYSLLGSLGVAGLVLALTNSRKIEYVRFRNDTGMLIFDIPRDLGRSEEYSQFVRLLVETISKVRGEPRPAEVMPDEP